MPQDEAWQIVRHLPDGRVLAVMPMLFGKARLCVGDGWSIEDGW